MWSYPLLGAAVGLLLGVVLFVVAEAMERELMDAYIEDELEHFIALVDHDPTITEAHSSRWQAYRMPPGEEPADVPGVGDLPPGVHELSANETTYDIGIAEHAGQRFYLVFDDTDFEQREQYLGRAMLAAVVLAVLLSTWLGRWIARRVIEPVTTLSAEVERMERHAATGLPVTPLAEFGDDEIGALARRFQRYQARLDEFLRRERAFTADASHELRTPLAVIRAASENLLASPRLSPDLAVRVQRIERAAIDMSELLDLLLMLAREQGSEVPTEHTDVGALTQRLIARELDMARDRHVDIRLESGAAPRLAAPEAACALIVANLLRNAREHAGDSPIAVRIAATRLCVDDSGPGIPDGERERLLQRGERGNVPMSRGAESGRGLGLAIATHICARFDWHLTLENRAEGGLTACWEFAREGRVSD